MELWIAAQQDSGQEYRRVNDSLDSLEISDDDESDELGWQVTLRPTSKFIVRPSLWI